MATELQKAFLSLVRLGVGAENVAIDSEFKAVDW